MSQYKVGDKVLVRAEIALLGGGNARLSINDSDVYVNQEDIYSLAQPFSPGEMIEVSNDDQWVKAKFVGVFQSPVQSQFDKYMYLTLDGLFKPMEWMYARKIEQPKERYIYEDGKKFKLVEVE